jgi:secreted protein with Ig-like and vWFA domain
MRNAATDMEASNGQKRLDLSTTHLLNTLGGLIYSGSEEELKRVQLSLISTAEAACRAILQTAFLYVGAKLGAKGSNFLTETETFAQEEGDKLLLHLH